MAEDSDALAGLEDRITRAVQALRELRDQNAELVKRLETVTAERDAAIASAAAAKQASMEAEKYRSELDQLKNERKHVRTRIEKLLGQMDLLGNQ